MANDFDFADFGEAFDAFAAMIRAQRLRGIGGGHVERRQFERALAGRGLFEDQPFVLIGVARRFFDFVGHGLSVPWCAIRARCREAAIADGLLQRAAASAARPSRSMSARVVVSVTQTSACLVSSG